MTKTAPTKKLYAFKGAVTVYGRVTDSFYRAQTWAPTAAKARSNIAYQYKMAMKLLPNAPVKLVGDIIAVA